ncbi:RNase A-like domain-containing protein [Streptomyces parvus]|uniref:RNase A-like domain-containing protein n=1 Tax=Streptomyces parvus TaxID=66428 RepID=UPI0035E27855
MRNRSATYPDRETAQWATQQVVTANEQRIHRWLAQGTRARLTVEAAWPTSWAVWTDSRRTTGPVRLPADREVAVPRAERA